MLSNLWYINNKMKKNLIHVNALFKGNAFILFSFFNLPQKHVSNWQLGFQNPASPTMEGIVSFHDDLLLFLSFILGFVIYVLAVCLKYFTSDFIKDLSFSFLIK